MSEYKKWYSSIAPSCWKYDRTASSVPKKSTSFTITVRCIIPPHTMGIRRPVFLWVLKLLPRDTLTTSLPCEWRVKATSASRWSSKMTKPFPKLIPIDIPYRNQSPVQKRINQSKKSTNLIFYYVKYWRKWWLRSIWNNSANQYRSKMLVYH